MSTTRQQTAKRRQAQLAAQQAQARKARRARLGVAGALVAVAAVLISLTVAQGDDAPAGQAAAGGLLTSPPPWPAQPTGLQARVKDLGFPPVGDESYHAHALLSVYRDGQPVDVPADLGYDQRGVHSSLHTHTPDGVIHMEADNPYPYRLSHVMTTWGVAFGPDRLGGDTATADKKVHVYRNGQPASPEVELKDGDNVVVAYGTDGSFPTQPPTDALNNA